VIEPKNVFLPDVTQGSEEAQQKVTVEVRKGAKDKISAISTYSKKIQIKEIEKSDRKAVFVVSVSPETPVGELRDRVVISLTGGSRTSINLPVFASVLGPLRFVPSSLSFGLIEGTEMIKRSVKLENRGKEPVEIKKVTTSNPAVQAEFKPIKAGKLYVIDIMVDPAQVKDDLRATVEVITDTGQEKPLSLSVYGILPPAV
ncbi:MAG: DUF1573 domain-containing protein, partial [Bdellovibrionales bacterium]|nr:DUF1573 domain-containing protein [Bdellovibrionales bacterium]